MEFPCLYLYLIVNVCVWAHKHSCLFPSFECSCHAHAQCSDLQADGCSFAAICSARANFLLESWWDKVKGFSIRRGVWGNALWSRLCLPCQVTANSMPSISLTISVYKHQDRCWGKMIQAVNFICSSSFFFLKYTASVPWLSYKIKTTETQTLTTELSASV